MQQRRDDLVGVPAVLEDERGNTPQVRHVRDVGALAGLVAVLGERERECGLDALPVDGARCRHGRSLRQDRDPLAPISLQTLRARSDNAATSFIRPRDAWWVFWCSRAAS